MIIRALMFWLVLILPAAAAEPPRVVAFGDSLTAGYGLARDKGLVPQLAVWLARNGTPAVLVNQGLSGDTTYGGRARLGFSLRGGADAVIVELGGNDMLLGWSPERAEQNLDAILSRASAGGRPVLLVGIHAPGRRQEWRQRWAAIWPRLAERHGAVLLPDLYAPLSAIPRQKRAEYLLADGIHPSSKGVELLVDHLGPQVQKLIERID